LEKKSCDLIVLNGPSAMDAVDNEVEVLDRQGRIVGALGGSKARVARGILRIVQEQLVEKVGVRSGESTEKFGPSS